MQLRSVKTMGHAFEVSGYPKISLPSVFMQELDEMAESGQACIAILMSEELAEYIEWPTDPELEYCEFEGVPVYTNVPKGHRIIFVTELVITRDDISA